MRFGDIEPGTRSRANLCREAILAAEFIANHAHGPPGIASDSVSDQQVILVRITAGDED